MQHKEYLICGCISNHITLYTSFLKSIFCLFFISDQSNNAVEIFTFKSVRVSSQCCTANDNFTRSLCSVRFQRSRNKSNSEQKKLKSVIFNSSFAFVLTVFVSPARENLPSRFKFKEYCPMVFRNLRERFCIDDQDYQVRPQTLTHKQKCSLALTGA